jgi:thioredoxin 1
MAEVIELTDANFEEFLSSHEGAVVDFYAKWCMPCRMMEPAFKGAASECDGSVGFGRLNVDSAPVASTKYGIRSIPTLIFFRQGQPVEELVGVRPKSQIADRAKNLVA